MNGQIDRVLNIKLIDESYEDFFNFEFITESLRAELLKAHIIILPRIREKRPIFEIITEDLFQYLKDNETDNSIIEICITEDKFQYIRSEAEEVFIELGIFLLFEFALKPLIEKLIKFFKKRREEKRQIKLKFYIKKTKTNKVIELDYQGPADKIDDIIEKINRV